MARHARSEGHPPGRSVWLPSVVRFQQNPKSVLEILPHRSTLNSNNRRLWHVLHDMLLMYDEPCRRIRMSLGQGLSYRVRDDLWWMATMRCEAAGDEPARRARFFFVVPEHLHEVLGIKWANHPQWSRCTIRPLGPGDCSDQLSLDAEVFRLRLGRHDMFSLAFDYGEQTTPIRDILHVLKELRAGDSVHLMFRFQAVSRQWWRERSDYAWKVWQGGGLPRRLGLEPGHLWTGMLGLAQETAGYVFHLADDILTGLERSLYGRLTRERDTNQARLLSNAERQAMLVNGDLSQRTYQKRNLPVFAAGLYLMVKAGTDARREMLAHSAAAAFGGLAGDNYLVLQQIRSPAYMSRVMSLEAPEFELDPALLSVDEVGKLVQLPTADLQEEFSVELESSRAIEIDLPKTLLEPTGIFMGTAALRGSTFNIHIPTGGLKTPEIVDKLMTARVMIGSPRMGKDMACVNLVVESRMHHGIGAVIVDVIDERNGHRGMADAVRDHLPSEHIIDLDLSDFEYPTYIGTAHIPTSRNERIAATQLADIVTSFYLGEDAITNHQTASVLRECAKAVRGDPLSIELMLTNSQFRARKLAEARSLGLAMTNLEDYHSLGNRNGQGRQGQIAAPILVRLGEITANEALRPIFCQQPKPEADLTQWLREGKVVIYRIPNRDLLEAVRPLAHWIVMTVFLTKQALQGQGAPTWLVLNEPHQFLSPGLVHFCKRLLAEGPKHRLAPIFLLQNFKLLQSPTFVEILMSCSLNWHIFKNTNIHVYEELAEYLAPTFDPSSAMAATPAYHYIARWLNPNGEYEPPFMMAAPLPVSRRYRSLENGHLTQQHSWKYGRHISEVLQEIETRQSGKARS